MPGRTITYARARLWLGISGVGTFVCLAALALALQLPHRAAGTRPSHVLSDWSTFTTFYMLYAIIGFPFDFLGGFKLPCAYGRICSVFPVFWWKWVRGVAVQGTVMVSSGMFLLNISRRWGLAGALLGLGFLQLLLIALQHAVAITAGGFKVAPTSPGNTVALSGLDGGFSGGIPGLPGRERIVFPAAWQQMLDSSVWQAQHIRRLGLLKTGSRLRGLLLASAFNLVGVAISASWFGGALHHASDWISVFLGCTLWSFLGLLILPSLSRPGVLEADRYALEQGIPATALRSAMSEIDQMQEDEPVRDRWIERIFHPIPSVSTRQAALQAYVDRRPFGFWHAARMALYLSWANFGLLSRAVHCNAGRPELWVMLPSD